MSGPSETIKLRNDSSIDGDLKNQDCDVYLSGSGSSRLAILYRRFIIVLLSGIESYFGAPISSGIAAVFSTRNSFSKIGPETLLDVNRILETSLNPVTIDSPLRNNTAL
ncbi:hypothetical protein OGAPHI_000194 [Ogataea philodendri]|uniref:Uncharacterized protein n=1 Tax=Ogataea philodendri TaxID=1378263 RepID=A0A9P8PG85_9ASCO|nr:uncharacterized protein OGAPHI_000194 [Ogataea philodendri]KAH3671492.1 hypothetical protein OGAPHI_000194 [Ogataea philodendri]